MRISPPLRQQDWLALNLLGLHAALAVGPQTRLGQAALLFHFGCFLLWQPVWRGERRLYPGQVVLVLGMALLLVAWDSLWLLALWICILFALIGGEVTAISRPRHRRISLLAALYLLTVLLLWVVPRLFDVPGGFTGLFLGAMRYGMLFPVLGIFLVREERGLRAPGESVDLFLSLTLFLLVVLLMLGAFTIRQVSHGDYALALAQTLVVVAALLVGFSWLWDPRGGFAGLGQVLTGYVLSIGIPFERWMHRLATLADQEREPETFLAEAVREMAQLPFVSGVQWRTPAGPGRAGQQSAHATTFDHPELTLTLHTRWAPGPALLVHLRLLARLLAEFHDAKRREVEERHGAYLRAVAETGSRLTHDVKNLLQSLRSLCAAVEAAGEEDLAAGQRLVRRHLPQIAARLQITLDKLELRDPARLDPRPAIEWWQELRVRHAHDPVSFLLSPLPEGAVLPGELFDSVGGNLIQNALAKRHVSADLRVTVRLNWDGAAALEVEDSGEQLAGTLAARLFNTPVASVTGLGVGLYQSARQAARQRYRLSLAQNRQGAVCFRLAPDPSHGN